MKYRITMKSTCDDVPPEVIIGEGFTYGAAALALLKEWENRFPSDNPFAALFEGLGDIANGEGMGVYYHSDMSCPEENFEMTGEMLPNETFVPKPNRVFVRVRGGVVQGACADDPTLQVIVIDYDNEEEDEESARENAKEDAIADTLTAVF